MNCSSEGSRRVEISSARGDAPEQLVERGQPLARSLLARLLEERGELDQLEVAGDGAVHVLGRVEAHLGKRRARSPGRLEHLVPDHAVGRVQSFGRTEDLLFVDLLDGLQRPAHQLVERRRARRLAACLLGPRQHRRARRAAYGQVREPALARGDQLLSRLRKRPDSQLLRDPAVLPGSDPHRPGVKPEEVDAVEFEALDLPRLGDHHRAGRGRIHLVWSDVARLGHRGDVAHEVANRAARDAAGEVRGELGEA